jgi:hypothetical protein
MCVGFFWVPRRIYFSSLTFLFLFMTMCKRNIPVKAQCLYCSVCTVKEYYSFALTYQTVVRICINFKAIHTFRSLSLVRANASSSCVTCADSVASAEAGFGSSEVDLSTALSRASGRRWATDKSEAASPAAPKRKSISCAGRLQTLTKRKQQPETYSIDVHMLCWLLAQYHSDCFKDTRFSVHKTTTYYVAHIVSLSENFPFPQLISHHLPDGKPEDLSRSDICKRRLWLARRKYFESHFCTFVPSSQLHKLHSRLLNPSDTVVDVKVTGGIL